MFSQFRKVGHIWAQGSVSEAKLHLTSINTAPLSCLPPRMQGPARPSLSPTLAHPTPSIAHAPHAIPPTFASHTPSCHLAHAPILLAPSHGPHHPPVAQAHPPCRVRDAPSCTPRYPSLHAPITLALASHPLAHRAAHFATPLLHEHTSTRAHAVAEGPNISKLNMKGGGIKGAVFVYVIFCLPGFQLHFLDDLPNTVFGYCHCLQS